MIHFLRKRGLQHSDAEDLAQDVMKSVSKAIATFEYDPERRSFPGWLFTILENQLRRFLAEQRSHRRGSGGTQMLLALQNVPDTAVEELWNQGYEAHLLTQAASAIRPEFQESTWRAFWGTSVEDRSASELSAEIGISSSAVYMAKHRVIKRLPEYIQYLEGGTG